MAVLTINFYGFMHAAQLFCCQCYNTVWSITTKTEQGSHFVTCSTVDKSPPPDDKTPLCRDCFLSLQNEKKMLQDKQLQTRHENIFFNYFYNDEERLKTILEDKINELKEADKEISKIRKDIADLNEQLKTTKGELIKSDDYSSICCYLKSSSTIISSHRLIKEDLLIKSLEPIEANSKSPLEYIYNIDLERVSINGFTLCSSDTKSFNCALSVLSSYLDCLTIIYKNKSSSDVMSYSFIHQMGSTIFQSNKFGKKTSKDIIIQFTLSSTRKREPSVSFTKSNDQESSLVQGINGLVNVMANLGKKFSNLYIKKSSELKEKFSELYKSIMYFFQDYSEEEKMEKKKYFLLRIDDISWWKGFLSLLQDFSRTIFCDCFCGDNSFH